MLLLGHPESADIDSQRLEQVDSTTKAATGMLLYVYHHAAVNQTAIGNRNRNFHYKWCVSAVDYLAHLM